MIFTETRLKGAYVIDLEPKGDERGFFARAFCRRELAAHGIDLPVAQANMNRNLRRGLVRGLHFQYAAAPEAKLVRCTRGAILDVIVDLRPESPTFLEHVEIELSDGDNRAVYVPPRFAHGNQTLRDDSDLLYLTDAYYAPGEEGGLPFDDPALAIAWALPPTQVSAKDRAWRPYAEIAEELGRRMTVQTRMTTEAAS